MNYSNSKKIHQLSNFHSNFKLSYLVSSNQGDDINDLESEPPSTPDQEKMPPEGPELNGQREVRKVFDTEWPASVAVITGSLPVEPVGSGHLREK